MFLKNALPGWPGDVYSLSQSAMMFLLSRLGCALHRCGETAHRKIRTADYGESPRDDGGGPLVLASLPSFFR